jgi:hypothetical protein
LGNVRNGLGQHRGHRRHHGQLHATHCCRTSA